MSLFETEVSLTSEQFDHYKWQFYYLLPWVRNVYQAMHLGIIGGEEENFEIVDAIKSLFLYYVESGLFGEFDLDAEQEAVDVFKQRLVGAAGMEFEEMYVTFLDISENRSQATDGSLYRYCFGQESCGEIFKTRLDEVRQHDSQVGFIGWHPRYVKGVIEKIAYYIEGQVGDRPDLEPVSLWGNVARGIYEAAIIYAGLQHAGVESSFHLFRVSPFAFSDKAAVLIGEPDKMPGWVIGADNFSGGGRSVTEAIRLFSEFDCEAVSTYLTHGGFLWRRDRGFNLEFSDEEVLDNRLMFRIDLDEAI